MSAYTFVLATTVKAASLEEARELAEAALVRVVEGDDYDRIMEVRQVGPPVWVRDHSEARA